MARWNSTNSLVSWKRLAFIWILNLMILTMEDTKCTTVWILNALSHHGGHKMMKCGFFPININYTNDNSSHYIILGVHFSPSFNSKPIRFFHYWSTKWDYIHAAIFHNSKAMEKSSTRIPLNIIIFCFPLKKAILIENDTKVGKMIEKLAFPSELPF